MGVRKDETQVIDVQAVCPYQLQNLSKLPFYSIASTVNISSASTFRNFY